MSVNFNRIAAFYDLLSRFVFGNQLETAANLHLPLGKEGVRILLLGGGTGHTLTSLIRNNKNSFILNLDSSVKMQEYSRGKVHGLRASNTCKIEYCCCDFQTWHSSETFDYIVAPFFLDLFPEKKLKILISKISSLSKSTSKIIVSDFNLPSKSSGRIRTEILYHTMYRFFNLTTGIEAGKLEDIRKSLIASGLQEVQCSHSENGRVFSGIYQRNPAAG